MNTILILLLLCIGFLILDVRNLHHRMDDIQVSKDTTDQEQQPIKVLVARDKAGDLFAYTKEPERGQCVWLSTDGIYIHIPRTLFPNLSWEDNPIEAEMTIKQATRHD
jgi:hypothetical protein